MGRSSIFFVQQQKAWYPQTDVCADRQVLDSCKASAQPASDCLMYMKGWLSGAEHRPNLALITSSVQEGPTAKIKLADTIIQQHTHGPCLHLHDWMYGWMDEEFPGAGEKPWSHAEFES